MIENPDTGEVARDEERAKSSRPLAAIRGAGLVAAALAMLFGHAVQALIARREDPDALKLRWMRRWMVIALRIVNMRVGYSGPLPVPGALLAPNHQGYPDMLALNSVLECFFVAKAEVQSWPAIGWIFRYTRQIGIPREKRLALPETVRMVEEHLSNGHSVCVFLEGTSTGGDRLLRFHSSLVQAAINASAPVVPVSIRWSSPDPAVSTSDDIAYWKRGEVFAAHLWRLLGLRGLTADITFGDPISSSGLTRAELATKARDVVASLHTSQISRCSETARS